MITHKSEHLYILMHLIYTQGRHWERFKILQKKNKGPYGHMEFTRKQAKILYLKCKFIAKIGNIHFQSYQICKKYRWKLKAKQNTDAP